MDEEILVSNQIMTEKLLCLLRNALWGGNPEIKLPSKDFSEVLNLAEEQTIFGLVFDALKDKQFCGMTDRMPIYEAIGQSEHIKQQNALVNKELCAFVRECDKIGLNYLVVKGQTIGSLYPKPELRQTGDIDFLQLAHLDYNVNLNKIFPNAGIPDKLSEKEYAFVHNGITYELHTRLIDFGCQKHQKLWAGMEAGELVQRYTVKVNDVDVRTLSPTMNAAYLFVHLFFHLIREGISLRQFCDWAIFLHTCCNQINRQKLTEYMKNLDMLEAYRAFGCFLVDELGLPEDEFPMNITEEDRRWKKKILDDVFRGGNFGKQNHMAESALEYKFETLRLAFRNSIRYYKLAPSEMRMMIPKMIGINIKLIFY